MKLTAKLVPYSSIIGGGLSLIDETGQVRYIIGIMGASQGISKKENDSLCNQLEWLINEIGLDIQ